MPVTATASHRTSWLDKSGIVAAIACALHCLLLPLLMGFLSMSGLTRLAGEDTEWALLSASVLLGLTSLLPGYRRCHRRPAPFCLFGAGLLLILSARFFCEDRLFIEIPMVVAGALFLAAGHGLNYHLCQMSAVCPAVTVSSGQ